jgi:hypothetical protein
MMVTSVSQCLVAALAVVDNATEYHPQVLLAQSNKCQGIAHTTPPTHTPPTPFPYFSPAILVLLPLRGPAFITKFEIYMPAVAIE